MRTVSRLVIFLAIAVTPTGCGLSRPTPVQDIARSGEILIPTETVPNNATTPNAAPTIRGQDQAGNPTATSPERATDVTTAAPTAEASVEQPDGAQGTSGSQEAAEPTESAAIQSSDTASALTDEQRQLLASLEARGAAPEVDNEVWLNSEPLRLADLRGRVVLLEFWTFG